VPASIQEPVTSEVVAEGHILPKDNLHLSFQTPGLINSIEVSEGASITEGQILASLGDRAEAEHAVASARVEMEAAQQEYDQVVRTAGLVNAQAWTAFLDAQEIRAEAEEEWEKLDLDQIDDDIEDAESDVKDYQADLKDAQEDLDKYIDLDEDSSKRKDAEDDLEVAQEDYNEAIRKLEEIIQKRDLKRAALDEAIQSQAEAKRSYENSLGQPDKDAFSMADRRLEQAKAQLASAEQQLSYFDLAAPFNGIVTDVNASIGEWVTPTTWVIGVADTSEWYVETTDLSELDVLGIQAGQQVEITADAIPGETFTGTVEEIGIEPVDQGGDIYYTIRIKITNPDKVIKWGMTVEVKFPNGNTAE
jgi:multidrug resistance efflux pump